ncbi:MAG: hypothetical protein SV375_09390 [Thermodesulfobacteriota bacterium]|nr:hypothetical protein [Thermodesulfobacteriota bacterium]
MKGKDMFKKLIYLSIILVVISVCTKRTLAEEMKHAWACELSCIVLSAEYQSGMISQTEEYRKLEKELKDLVEEMKRLEKDVKEKLRIEILPLIRREIEKLRKQLRKFHLEDDKSKDEDCIWT